MSATACACCGTLREFDQMALLVMPDLTVRRVCLIDINKMWRKYNPDMKAARNAARQA
jgi:hypothetical protein